MAIPAADMIQLYRNMIAMRRFEEDPS